MRGGELRGSSRCPQSPAINGCTWRMFRLGLAGPGRKGLAIGLGNGSHSACPPMRSAARGGALNANSSTPPAFPWYFFPPCRPARRDSPLAIITPPPATRYSRSAPPHGPGRHCAGPSSARPAPTFPGQFALQSRLPDSLRHQLRQDHSRFRVAVTRAPNTISQPHGQAERTDALKLKLSWDLPAVMDFLYIDSELFRRLRTSQTFLMVLGFLSACSWTL
jgi:hypothetical protein